MKQFCKRGFSFLLSLCMLFTLIPAGAADAADAGESVFDFEAAKYSVKENEGGISVKIVRQGDTNAPVNVAVKAADFLAEYGKDYEVLLDGKPLSAQKGEVIDPSMFTFDPGQPVGETAEPVEDTEEPVTDTPEAVTDTEESATDTPEAVTDAEESATDTPEAVTDTEESATDTPEAVTDAEEPVTDAAEPATDAEEPATDTPEPVTDTEEPATDTPEAVTDTEEPVEDTPEPVTDTAETVEPVEDMEEAATETEEAVTDTPEAVPDTEEPVDDTAEVVEEVDVSSGDALAAVDTAEPVKVSSKSNSPLLDAQKAYLHVPDDESQQQTQDALEEITKDFHKFFEDAQGAQGVVYFAPGVTERVLTVRVIDNDTADGPRMFLMSLLGTDSDKAAVALNNNASVTIEDDEEYEPSTFSLYAVDKTLTVDKPTATVKVTRTGGLQYFASAYVSTVTETALSSAYEKMELREVGFIPGQRDAEITVTAKEFDGGTFGLRLESDGSDFTREHYLTFTIAPQNATQTGDASGDDTAELQAGGITLGSSSIYYGNRQSNSFSSFPGGWKTEKTGGDRSNRANTGSQFYVSNYDNNKHSMIVSKSKWNFTGVTNIRFSMTIGGSNRRNGKWTMFGASSNQSWSSYSAAYTRTGNMGWEENNVNVASLKGGYYIKFGSEATKGGGNNPETTLDWFRFDYAKYTFDLPQSPRSFQRVLYDFSQGTPQISGIYYDGTTNTLYNPGAVKIEANRSEVGAFYTNAERSVTIKAADSKAAQRGFKLAGVYFVKTDRSASSMWDGQNYTNTGKYYYVSANSSGEVSVKLGASFVETLISKGILSSSQRNETIRIYPRFEQEMTEVHFENTDRPSSAPKAYDASHLASHFANIIESYNRGTRDNSAYWQGLSSALSNGMTYYKTFVPKGSVIRLKVIPSGDRTAQGANWWTWSESPNRSGTTCHHAGDKTASPNVITTTDYTMADIVLDMNHVAIKPVTGQQTFYVGLFPGASTPDGMSSLKNAVMDISGGSSGTNTGVNTANDSGVMNLENPSLGKVYTLRANPPQGYYAFWTRMTGDTDNNGDVTPEEMKALGDINVKSSNPEYIWGNIVTIKLDQDNTRYYYEFLPQVSGNSSKRVSGNVVRQNNTLIGLVRRDADTAAPVAVANAYISAAGQDGRTDANGNYTIPLPESMPKSGDISMTLSRDGRTYYSAAKIQRSTKWTLPALEAFEPKAVYASYEESGTVSGTMISAEDDNLSVTVAVTSSGTVIPVKAYFSLYHVENQTVNGQNTATVSERFPLSWYDSAKKEDVFKDGYSVDYRTENVYGKTTLYATITFNPRQDAATGDVLYVSFADQSGVVYTPIDIGYTFCTPLTLGEFIFGMIGSPTLEDVVTNSGALDLIGDPLGNTDLGAVNGFQKSEYDYTPANVSIQNRAANTFKKTAHTFGWSAEFSSSGGFDFNKDVGNSEEAFDDFIASLDDAKGGTGGGFSASGSYSFSITPEIGFRLTTSQRKGSTNHYFEDLVFYVKLTFDVSAEATISTPIYVDILIGGRLSGSMAGVYHMYMAYQDFEEKEGLLPFDSEHFGLFKKFPNNPVQREGYIFLDPQVDLKLGVGIASCFITGTAIFNFDIDFQFTSARVNAYADMTYSMEFGIQAFGIEIFSYNTPKGINPTFKLFNTSGTNGHINFGYEVAQTLNATLMSAADNDITRTKPVDRSYLSNRGEWQVFDAVTLLDAEGSVEKPLRDGTASDMQIQIVPMNTNGDLLMAFVDDVPTRSDGNKRAVYYSVYSASGDSWSTPAVIHDDGTPDDYPALRNLGDGRILAAWSSAESAMSDDVNLETMASAMNIEVAFFDTSSRTFGEPAVLTKTTEADYSADTMPHAAYDPETGRVILYYTKTEYRDMETLSDYGAAESIVAYLFYENGKWTNTGDTYTADELEGMTDAEITEYKADWYGQRFLEPRLNLNSSELPRIVDTAAIGYNGLALFAYTVDWDNSLQTVNDRDVLLQIYNFSENSFTHIIRVTNETGSYALPKLARSNNRTYLFYGEKPQGQDEHGVIRALDVSYVIHNELYQLVTEGDNAYYVLRGKSDPVTLTDSEGGSATIPGETVDIVADVVTECDTLTDYDAFVADDGRMYLLWTDSRAEGEGRNIYASLFNTGDSTLDGQDGTYDKEGQNWSAPVALTDGGEDTYFSGLGTASMKDSILLVSAKGSYADASRNSITQITHTPFSKLIPDGDLTFDNPYAAAGQSVQVTATLKNTGLETFVPGENGVRVTFQVNGTDAAEEVYYGSIPGGSSIEVTADVEVPEGNAVTVSASCNGETVSTALERGARMRVADEALEKTLVDARAQTEGFRYVATLSNDGNEPSGTVKLTVKSGETVLGEFTADAVQPGEQTAVDMLLDIPESAWKINGEGVGTLTADISARDGSKDFWTSNQDLSRYFDADAIALMKQVKSVKSESFSIKSGELALLLPEIQGVDAESVTVEWLSSDNEAVAFIDHSNMISGVSAGTTTLHGMVVPSTEVLSMNADGEFTPENWVDKIPESLQKPVTAQVTVMAAETPDNPDNPDNPSNPDNPDNPSNPDNPDNPSNPSNPDNPATKPAKKGCYVATSVYGSYDCPEVWTLRRFRDEVLADTWYGRLFIRVYYALSPTAVKLFGDCEWFQNFWRGRLDTLVDALQSDGFASTPYDDTQW